MARPLQFLPIQSPMEISTMGTVVFVVVAVLAVVSLISFLCTSHHHRQSERLVGKFSPPAERKLMTNLSGISSKALLMAKMISWRKSEGSEEEEEQDDEEEAIWKKTIIMGERCRPLDFSGRILYDSQGNRLPDMPKEAQRKIDASTESCHALRVLLRSSEIVS